MNPHIIQEELIYIILQKYNSRVSLNNLPTNLPELMKNLPFNTNLKHADTYLKHSVYNTFSES